MAAQILEMHPQTLRKYERAGFIVPPRMGVLRLYSEEDIARLRLIKHLTEELGLNLAGVELALDMINKLVPLRIALDSRGEDSAHTSQVIDEVLRTLGVEVNPPPRAGQPQEQAQGRRGAARDTLIRIGEVTPQHVRRTPGR